MNESHRIMDQLVFLVKKGHKLNYYLKVMKYDLIDV